MSAKIFISYRRDDEAGYALALQFYLASRFPKANVFMDVTGSIRPGEDFVEAIISNVGSSIVFLAVIGSKWLSLTRNRNAEEIDYIQLEISSALSQGKLVVPILINDVALPSEKALPPEISALSRRHGVRLRHEAFREGCARLADFLKEHLRSVDNIRIVSQSAAAQEIAQSFEKLTFVSLLDTVWDSMDSDGDKYIFRFLADGILRYTSPTGTFDNGRWTQNGSLVVFDMNNHYSTYTAKLDGHHMAGTAQNAKGHTWTFDASLNS